MNRVKHVSRATVNTLLIGVLATALLLGAFLMTRRESSPMVASPSDAYPGPTSLSIQPIATARTVSPIQPDPLQSATALQTYTPPPQPTQQLGPTATPRPLVSPAPDAAGRILYVAAAQMDAWGGASDLTVRAVNLDKTGGPTDSALGLTSDTALDIQWGLCFHLRMGPSMQLRALGEALRCLTSSAALCCPCLSMGQRAVVVS